MTRGRSKDHSIPLSRALIHQRDYRARKAKYVSDLEERCRRAEAENAKLHKELEMYRSKLPVRPAMFTSETAHAAAELMQRLSAVSDSLARFQQLAYTNQQPSPSPVPTQSRSKTMPTPTASSSISPTSAFFQSSYDEISSQIANFPTPIDTSNTINAISNPYHPLSASPGSDEECCGGLIDCRLVEDSTPEEDIDDIISNPLVNNSNMRSTSGFS